MVAGGVNVGFVHLLLAGVLTDLVVLGDGLGAEPWPYMCAPPRWRPIFS